MKPLRLALFGFGTVGQWLAEALHTQRARLQQEFGLVVSIIAVATAHYGLIFRSEGLDIPALLDLVATRQPLNAHPMVTHWTNILEGLQAISCDVLAEATGGTLRNGEPGVSYIRTALLQGMLKHSHKHRRWAMPKPIQPMMSKVMTRSPKPSSWRQSCLVVHLRLRKSCDRASPR